MTTIFKYPLNLTERILISMPIGARPLSVQMQGESLTLWAIVDTTQANELRAFRIFGTGYPLTSEMELSFLGTVQDRGFVWHIFAEPATP